MHLDIQLALGRDFGEAPAAGIAFNRNNGQAVTRIGTDTLIGVQQTIFDLRFC